MTLSVFLDLNVWVALTLTTHEHHQSAWAWYQELPETVEIVFCRFTQMGFLRLMTTESIVGTQVLNQREAWAVYDRWTIDLNCVFADEPAGLDREFRSLADRTRPSPKEWADSYLAAFAFAASLRLITFDKALHRRAKGSLLLA